MAAALDMATVTVAFDSPAIHAVLLTPNDSTDLTNSCRALYVGGAGNIKVTTVGGDTLLFTGVSAGSILPVACSRVWSTTTTATTIVALR